jgi:hypothetical protein
MMGNCPRDIFLVRREISYVSQGWEAPRERLALVCPRNALKITMARAML